MTIVQPKPGAPSFLSLMEKHLLPQVYQAARDMGHAALAPSPGHGSPEMGSRLMLRAVLSGVPPCRGPAPEVSSPRRSTSSILRPGSTSVTSPVHLSSLLQSEGLKVERARPQSASAALPYSNCPGPTTLASTGRPTQRTAASQAMERMHAEAEGLRVQLDEAHAAVEVRG